MTVAQIVATPADPERDNEPYRLAAALAHDNHRLVLARLVDGEAAILALNLIVLRVTS